MSKQSQDISKRALQEFLSEADEIIEKLNQDLLRLDEESQGGSVDPDLLNGIFRSAHSLKGLSGMFGFTEITSLAHNLENMLDKLRLGRLRLNPALTDTLLASVELLRKIVGQTSEGDDRSEEKQVAVMISRLESVLHDSEEEGKGGPLGALEIDPEMLSVLTEYEEHRLIENINLQRRIYKVHATFDLLTFDESLTTLTTQLKQLGEVITTLPAASPSKESEIEFEIVLGSDRGERALRDAIRRADVTLSEIPYRSRPSGEADTAGKRTPADEIALVKASETEGPEEGVESLKSLSETVRVDIGKLDILMNLVGELGLVRTSVGKLAETLKGEAGSGSAAKELRKIAKDLDHKLTELQSGVMDVRMVPLRNVFEKLSRIVRTTSRDLRKDVRLEVEGADTELDKLIIEDLIDPLMHIIRNAIDHGIEAVPERLAAGKPEEGTIWIKATQRGNHVVIDIEDDGQGMQKGRIYDTAVSRGLIQKDAQLSDREILDLIMLPGFSTKSEVTETSGRGVGLDIVRESIAKLSGIIDIDSEPGVGTRFSIVIPITLAIIQALLVTVRGRTYAVPLNAVLECLTVRQTDIQTVERREVLQVRDDILPLVRLSSIFGLEGEEELPEKSFVVVVGLAEHRLGIVVDGLLGRQDIVIKSLGKLLPSVEGIAGATELGDQQTVLVIDIGALIDGAVRRKE